MRANIDVEKAKRYGLKFEIARKANRHGSWEAVGRRTTDAQTTLSQAAHVDGHEVCVFVYGPEDLGYVYWSSRHPATINDTIIDQLTSDS